MSRRRTFFAVGAAITIASSSALSLLNGQVVPRPAGANSASAAPESAAEQVVIQREALQLTDPDAYRVPLYLVPVKSLELTTLTDGVVSSVLVKPGQKVTVQAEAVRLNPAELQLLVDRAEANYRAAQVEARIAGGKNDQDLKDLAGAKLDAAKADLDLAKLRLERATIRVPFASDVLRIHVTEGELVRAGEPLATVGDTSAMKVEVPVDRNQTQPGQTVELRVEDRTVQGKIETLLPLADKFEPLRELVNSVASAVVVLDNSQGQLQPGQTVYPALIPRHPVAEIPNAAVENGTDGTRKVQVVRDNVIRDVPVEILSSIGADRVYVSGPFAEGDEAIVEISQPLPDGTQVRATAQLEEAAETRRPGTRSTPQRRGGF